MADLDAELLALAGDDSGGEEESVSSPPRQPSSTPPRLSRDSPEPDMARKGIAKPVKKTKSRAKPVRRRKDYSSSEDDGSSPAPSRSASMSQSDSGGDLDPEDEKPKYPYQRIFWDAEDKRRIEAMPEIERENVLAERNEEVERHEQDRQLRQLIASRKRAEEKSAAKEKKRKASAANLEESPRKSTRQRTRVGGEASSAIAAYKKQREERNQPRKDVSTARLTSYEDEYSDEDADGESDHDYGRPKYRKQRSPSPSKEDPVAELEDIQRARIGRDNFAQVCFTPTFQQTVTGCYARVCLGPGRTPGVNEYRLCSIKGITTGRPYAMEGPNARKFITDQYIIAAHGKAERPWSFLECSMSRFTEDEWRRYRVTMANEDCKMPTKGTIDKKLTEINRLISYRLGPDEISQRLARIKAISDKVYRTEERDNLKEKIAEARGDGNEDRLIELEEQLVNLVPVKLAFGTTMGSKVEASPKKSQDTSKLAELNRRNERMNAENVRKAQLAEMHMRKAKKHLAPGLDDLFEGGSDISRAGTPVNGIGTPKIAASLSRAGTPNPTTQANAASKVATPLNGTPRSGTPVPLSMKTGPDKKKGGLPVIRKAALDDEILADMDLGIDIDI